MAARSLPPGVRRPLARCAGVFARLDVGERSLGLRRRGLPSLHAEATLSLPRVIVRRRPAVAEEELPGRRVEAEPVAPVSNAGDVSTARRPVEVLFLRALSSPIAMRRWARARPNSGEAGLVSGTAGDQKKTEPEGCGTTVLTLGFLAEPWPLAVEVW